MENSLYKHIKGKIIYILTISILSAASFYASSFLYSKQYKTDVYCYSVIFGSVHTKSVVRSFNTLIATRDIKKIKELTSLDEEVINQIKQVDYFEIISKENNYFKLSLVSESNKFTKNYLKGIIYYFENTGITKEIIKMEVNSIHSKIKNKTAAISNMDSIYSLMKTNSNVIFESNIEFEKNIIFDELEDEKIKLITSKGLIIINKPSTPINPFFPNRLIFGVFGFIFGLFGALFLFLLKKELI